MVPELFDLLVGRARPRGPGAGASPLMSEAGPKASAGSVVG